MTQSNKTKEAHNMAEVADLMTLEEVAEHLRVTKKTIYRMLEKQRIPSTRVGHQYRFQTDAIDMWLRHNSTGTAARILVVDDDKDICSLFEDVLEDAGHLVTTATSSAKALKLVNGSEFDMVFLDLVMPGMDGAELFREIRDVKPDLPVTIATGYPDSELMVKALEIGPFAVMKKPFTGDDILAVVRVFLHAGVPS